MLLKAIKKKFIQELTGTGLILTIGTLLFFHFFFPERYFQWFPLIPVFFYVFGLFYIYMFEFSCQLGADKIAMTYLICKVLKFILSALVLIFYGFVIFLRFEAKLKLSKQVKNEKNTVHSNNTAAFVGNSNHGAESGNGQ